LYLSGYLRCGHRGVPAPVRTHWIGLDCVGTRHDEASGRQRIDGARCLRRCHDNDDYDHHVNSGESEGVMDDESGKFMERAEMLCVGRSESGGRERVITDEERVLR